jgi:hypothetical protein
MMPSSALDHDVTYSSSSPAAADEPLVAKLHLFPPFHRPCRRSCLMPGLRVVFPHYRRKAMALSSLSHGEPLFWATFSSSSLLLVVHCHGQHHLTIGRRAPPSGCRASLPLWRGCPVLCRRSCDTFLTSAATTCQLSAMSSKLSASHIQPQLAIADQQQAAASRGWLQPAIASRDLPKQAIAALLLPSLQGRPFERC